MEELDPSTAEWEDERVRDKVTWKSSLVSYIPLALWLIICIYFWSTSTLDAFQITATIAILALFVYYSAIDVMAYVWLTTNGIATRYWRRREIAWPDVAGFELRDRFLRGRALCIILKNGSSIPIPFPSPGNARYEQNLERLYQWKRQYGDPGPGR